MNNYRPQTKFGARGTVIFSEAFVILFTGGREICLVGKGGGICLQGSLLPGGIGQIPSPESEKWAARILLECFLVMSTKLFVLKISHNMTWAKASLIASACNLPALAPMALPATRQPSTSFCGSCRIISLSLHVPGSPSSALTTRYLGLKRTSERIGFLHSSRLIECLIRN